MFFVIHMGTSKGVYYYYTPFAVRGALQRRAFRY